MASMNSPSRPSPAVPAAAGPARGGLNLVIFPATAAASSCVSAAPNQGAVALLPGPDSCGWRETGEGAEKGSGSGQRPRDLGAFQFAGLAVATVYIMA